MSLENVVAAVREHGRAETEALLDEARKERERILAEARAEEEKVRTEAELKAQQMADRRRAQELSRAELDARRMVLAAQKAQLDEVFQKVREGLASMPQDEALVRKILKANEDVWKGGGRVYATEKDASAVKTIAGKAFAGTIDGLGGVVLEDADGTIRLDLRYDSVLRDVWTNSMREVAEILWPSRAPKA